VKTVIPKRIIMAVTLTTKVKNSAPREVNTIVRDNPTNLETMFLNIFILVKDKITLAFPIGTLSWRSPSSNLILVHYWQSPAIMQTIAPPPTFLCSTLTS
jgi:hypothetical protein